MATSSSRARRARRIGPKECRILADVGRDVIKHARSHRAVWEKLVSRWTHLSRTLALRIEHTAGLRGVAKIVPFFALHSANRNREQTDGTFFARMVISY